MPNAFSAKVAMESKPTDVPVLFVRRGNKNMPIELCKGSRESLEVVIVRPGQAKNMFLELAKILME